uniref:hypothetical protein n=1 Tax=Mariniflexile sp. TaxID=1979402 RepID=UPI004048512A
MFITSNAQEDETFLITPNLTNKMSEHKGLIYPVMYEDVEFPVYKKGKKLTKYYLEQKEELLKYKPAFISYVKEEKNLAKQFTEIQSILNYIEDFNKSDEKFKEKIHYLITAQEIADKSNLKLIKQSGNVNIPSREILLYNPNKRTKEDDLSYYDEYIKDIKLETPYKTQDYKKYENLEK